MVKSIRAILFVCFFVMQISSIRGYAQKYRIIGTVSDDVTGSPIEGVTVSCENSGSTLWAVTGPDGKFQINLSDSHNAILKFTHIAYNSYSKLVNAADFTGHILEIRLTELKSSLDAAVIQGKSPLLRHEMDTITYKAENYKLDPDATAEDLIRKLPGLIYKDGQLEAQGQMVSEVYVDGKEFFKSDINMALKNLPENVIDEIQVFDKLSDYAQLAGFDDGSSKKIVNIKTKQGTDGTLFGKGAAGYGSSDRYRLYGMLNLFDNQRRASVFVQSNNINEQNFSTVDLLSSTGTISTNDPTQSPFSQGAVSNAFTHGENEDITTLMVDVSKYGITKTTAAGAKYYEEWKEGNMKLSGHYIFNVGANNTSFDIYDEYFGETTSNNKQYQTQDNWNLNHRVNLKYEYQFSDKDYIMVRPSFILQHRMQDAYLTDWTSKAGGDSLLLNQFTVTDQNAMKSNNEAMYIHRFNSKGHSLSLDVICSYDYTEEEMDFDLMNVQSVHHVLQDTDSDNKLLKYSAVASYVLPVTRFSKLKADAGYSMTEGLIRQDTQRKINEQKSFSRDSLLCGKADTKYGGGLFSLAYMLDKHRWNIVAGCEYHAYNMTTLNDRETVNHSDNAFLPFFYAKYNFGKLKWHLQYKAVQKFPAPYQLLDAINNSNAILSIRGNNRLDAAYHHTASSRLVLTDDDKGSVFVFFSAFEQADNYIGSRRSLSSTSFTEDGNMRNSEICSFLNIDGFWLAKGLLAYGFPIRPIRTNANLSTLVEYYNIPGYWDKQRLENRQWIWNLFLTLGSNISKNIDFVIDSNLKYTSSTNMAYDQMKVSYWSVSYGGQVKWSIIPSLQLIAECGQTNYIGDGVSKYNALIANASLGYKFLKNKQAEIKFTCHDIFNQDNSFYMTTTELFRREATASLLKRYFMLSFTYDMDRLPLKKRH